MNIVERFLNYTKFDTQSAEDSETIPSTSKQLVFAKYLKEELEKEGLEDVVMDEKIGEYNDNIENIVYNNIKMEKIKEHKKKTIKKLLKKQNWRLKKLETAKFKKDCKKINNSIYFDSCYDEVVKQKKEVIEKLKKKINDLEEMTLNDFFKELEQKEKDKMISMNVQTIPQDVDSMSTRIDEIIGKKFPKKEIKEKKKLQIINNIKSKLNSLKRRRRGLKKIKK